MLSKKSNVWKGDFNMWKSEYSFLSLGIRQKSFLILASKFTLSSWMVGQTEYSVTKTSECPALSWWYSYFRPYLNCFEQGEEFLVNALAKDHLRPPSVLPYNFSVPVEEVNTWGQYGQPAYIDEVFFKGQVREGCKKSKWKFKMAFAIRRPPPPPP